MILVEDYEEAFNFYEKNFFCKKISDQQMPDGQRYVHISFSADEQTGIWFLKPNQEDHSGVGKQTWGQPTIVIYTSNIEEIYTHLIKNKVTILGTLTSTPSSYFFHCLDLYGNRITIVQATS